MEKGYIKRAIAEQLAKGQTKESIRQSLLMQGAAERDILRQMIEFPVPETFKQHKLANTALVIVLAALTVLKLVFGISAFGITGLIVIVLNIVVIIALLRGRGWSYPLLAILSIVGLLQSAGGLVDAYVTPLEEYQQALAGSSVDPAAEAPLFRAGIIAVGWIELALLLVIVVLALYCWKKIHPDYKFKNLFTV